MSQKLPCYIFSQLNQTRKLEFALACFSRIPIQFPIELALTHHTQVMDGCHLHCLPPIHPISTHRDSNQKKLKKKEKTRAFVLHVRSSLRSNWKLSMYSLSNRQYIELTKVSECRDLHQTNPFPLSLLRHRCTKSIHFSPPCVNLQSSLRSPIQSTRIHIETMRTSTGFPLSANAPRKDGKFHTSYRGLWRLVFVLVYWEYKHERTGILLS